MDEGDPPAKAMESVAPVDASSALEVPPQTSENAIASAESAAGPTEVHDAPGHGQLQGDGGIENAAVVDQAPSETPNPADQDSAQNTADDVVKADDGHKTVEASVVSSVDATMADDPADVTGPAASAAAPSNVETTTTVTAAENTGNAVDGAVKPNESSDDDPLSSSDSDSSLDDDAVALSHYDDDDEDGENVVTDLASFTRGIMESAGPSGPEAAPRTVNEKEHWKSFQMPTVELGESHEVALLGVITSITDGYAVVVDPSSANIPGILDYGTPVCTEGRKLLGQIEEPILTVTQPRYWFGTNDAVKARQDGVEEGAKVYYVTSLATWVDLPSLQRQKFYDSSNFFDEEVDDDMQDFSDDDAEAAHRNAVKAMKKRARATDGPYQPGPSSNGDVLKYDDDEEVVEEGYRKLKRPGPGEEAQRPPLSARGGFEGRRRDRGPHNPRGRNNFHERFRGGRGRGGAAQRGGRPDGNRQSQDGGQSGTAQGAWGFPPAPPAPPPGQFPYPPPVNPAWAPTGYPVPPPPFMPGQMMQWQGMAQQPQPPAQMPAGMPQLPGTAIPNLAQHPYYIPGPWNNFNPPQLQDQSRPPWWGQQQ